MSLSAWMKNWKCQNHVAVGHYGTFLVRQSKILFILYGISWLKLILIKLTQLKLKI